MTCNGRFTKILWSAYPVNASASILPCSLFSRPQGGAREPQLEPDHYLAGTGGKEDVKLWLWFSNPLEAFAYTVLDMIAKGVSLMICFSAPAFGTLGYHT